MLTKNTDSIFELSFIYKLENKYTFTDMEKSEIKKFQKFLNIVSGLTFSEVDKKYLRPSDKTDKFHDLQVQHYGIDDKFRIHFIIENGKCVVIRLDPNHKYHN